MISFLSPRAGVLSLLIIAVVFGSNHVAARIAFDHGASVATAVAMRSGITALCLFALLRAFRWRSSASRWSSMSPARPATDAFALPRSVQGWHGLAPLTLFYGSAITALFVVLPRLGAASYAVVLNFEPIAVLFIAWGVLGQSVAPLQLLGALIVIGAITVPALRR